MPRILALDLSLTRTGWAFLERSFRDYTESRDVRLRDAAHGLIVPPSHRHKDESDWSWNRRRYDIFRAGLQALVGMSKPEVILIEVSKKVFSRKGEEATSGRYGAGVQYRAGQGLGRAMGWVDAALCDYPPGAFEVVSVDLDVAKRAITGNKTASKEQVRQFLEGVYGWHLKGWDQNEIDALSLGLAYLQNDFTTTRDAGRSTSPGLQPLDPPLSRRGSSTGDASAKRTRRPSRPSRLRAITGRRG